MREMKFDMAYIAQYSPRPETAAWKLKDNVSKKEKIRREKVLTEILEKTALENNKKYIGKMLKFWLTKSSQSLTLGIFLKLNFWDTPAPKRNRIFLQPCLPAGRQKNPRGKF